VILAGDIGGTKTVLALSESADVQPVAEETFRNQEFPDFSAVLERFLTKAGGSRVTAACLGVAGPVLDARVEMPNRGWVLDTADLARRLGIERVRLLNDLEAAAYGMLHLAPGDFRVLNAGLPGRRANAGVIAAGTGLGEALLCFDGRNFHPVASEGGHADFAPRTDEEIDLLRHLQRTVGPHVSYERVVSGPGLVNVYHFLRDTGRGSEPPELTARLGSSDPAAVIAESGLAREFEICTRALDLFTAVYGAEAGNLALRGYTLGGLYVGGGIAPKIIDKLADGTFMRAFADKGRYVEFLRGIPVAVALNPRAALVGATYFASRL
jgi:glucokinase